MPVNQKALNRTFLKLRKRAESVERPKLVDTFVDVGPLFTLLSNPEHQILYGRRGTGKTHALIFLAEQLHDDGDIPIYLDLRTIGSSGGIYASPETTTGERSTRLLSDTLATVHEEILSFVVDNSESVNLSVLGPLLDELAEAITEVEVVGDIKQEKTESSGRSTETSTSSTLGAGVSTVNFEVGYSSDKVDMQRDSQRTIREGRVRHRVHFGRVGSALGKIGEALAPRKIWILLDEWSSVPIDIQPYLADLIRRSVFPISRYVTKIAAIEQRTAFRLVGEDGGYIGIELGADAAADLDLDDYMVFGTKPPPTGSRWVWNPTESRLKSLNPPR